MIPSAMLRVLMSATAGAVRSNGPQSSRHALYSPGWQRKLPQQNPKFITLEHAPVSTLHVSAVQLMPS